MSIASYRINGVGCGSQLINLLGEAMVIVEEEKGFNIQVSNLEMSILKSCIENASEDFYSRIEVFLDNSPEAGEREILETLSSMRQKTFNI